MLLDAPINMGDDSFVKTTFEIPQPLFPQGKSHRRTEGMHAQAACPGSVVGEDRTGRWRQQSAEAVDGIGRRVEASP